MAEYQNLQATINAVIKANGVQAITGPVLNAVLNSMVTVLGDGYRFGGVAAPADNPGSPDNRVVYLASQAGTYTNFGGLTLSGEVALLCWDSAWTKETLFSIDAAPTPGSDNLISSGAVDTALTNLANSIAAAYMQLVPSAVEDHLASYDNAGQVKDSGLAAGDVVLKGGAYLGLFAGYAANLVDTRSAGTPQGPYAFRQSGGDGVDYMVRIKGRTEVFNQLFPLSPTMNTTGLAGEVTITNNGDGSYTLNGITTAQRSIIFYGVAMIGHTMLYTLGGSFTGVLTVGDGYTGGGVPYVKASAQTVNMYVYIASGQTLNNVVIKPNTIDLTLEGLGLTTAAAFQSLRPLPYYDYNAGVLKNNAATGIKTRGFNQWDEEWEIGSYDTATGAKTPAPTKIRSKNRIPVLGSTAYYLRGTGFQYVLAYNANGDYIGQVSTTASGSGRTFTTPSECAYVNFSMSSAYGTTYNHDICVNLFDASRNGTYEPYWERTVALGLNSLACHDENNNAVTLNGLDGVGSSYDEAVVENGMVTKIIKRFAEVDLGDLSWDYQTGTGDAYPRFRAGLADIATTSQALISSKYTAVEWNSFILVTDKVVAHNPNTTYVYVKDSAYSDAGVFTTAVTGVKLRYELATPKVLTVDNPFPAFVEVDNLGTQERLPADTAADPQGPFESDSNYSVSTANLVRALGL